MIEQIVDRGLKRLRFKEFLHRHLENSQDIVCEFMNYPNLYNQDSPKSLNFYQREFDFYKKAYREFEKSRSVEFERDLRKFKLEEEREKIQAQIEKTWSHYKQKRKSVFDDIYFYHEAQKLVNQPRS